MNARVHFSKSWKFNSNQKFKKSLLKTTTVSIKKILSNKISHKYNFHEEIHLLFKIKYLLLQFIYNISTSKCFHVLRSIGNPALQRVQFDQNLSPIRTQRSARVPCKSGVKRKATRRRYRLPLSWDIIGHGRAIRMPDWPHTTYISRGKLTRSWLNGKRYHTPPLPKLARFGISRDKLANTGPSTIRSYRVVIKHLVSRSLCRIALVESSR